LTQIAKALIAVFFLTASTIAADDAIKVTHQKISDTFYVFDTPRGQGANVGLVIGQDKLLIIDPGTRDLPNHQALAKAIREVSDKPFGYVVNTHHHSDHNGGNAFFAEQGATIIVQENIKYLDQNSARYKATYQQIFFADKLTIRLGTEEVQLFSAMSHTGNDLLVYLPNSNALFTGDNHATSWGPNLGFGGAKGQNAVMDLGIALSDAETTVVPGHGYITDQAHLKGYKDRTVKWVDRVMALHADGKTAEEITEDKLSTDILRTFNGDNTTGLMRKDRLARRIRLVIATETAGNSQNSTPDLEKYTGDYHTEDGSIIEIKIRKGKLFAMETGAYITQLFPISETTFNTYAYSGSTRTYEFLLSADGKATSVAYKGAGDTKSGTQR